MHYRFGIHSILLKNGNALVLFNGNKKTEIYDTVNGTFTFSGRMNQSRSDYTATLLKDGKVLIAGGEGYQPNLSAQEAKNLLGFTFTNYSTELYNPKAQQFKYSANMIAPRQGHTAVLLPNGNVLIAGGMSDTLSKNRKIASALLSSAEIYDTKTDSFKSTGNMITPRLWFSSILLNNGKVLVTGGKGKKNNDILNSAELYDPIGMPLTRLLVGTEGLEEVRCKISDGQIARIIFYVEDDTIFLLHGFIKKTQKTPQKELDLAIKRYKELCK